jgi:hypothetical protein
MTVRANPAPSLRELTDRLVRVRDIMPAHLDTLPPTRRASDAASELRANHYDVAPLREDPIRRYVLLRDLDEAKGRVARHARRIGSDDIVGADLALSGLLRKLRQRSHFFVLDGDEIVGIITVADLGAPPVGIAVLAHLVAIEAAAAELLKPRHGSDVVHLLSPARQAVVRGLYEQKVADGIDLGHEDCLYFQDWMTILRKTDHVLAELGLSASQFRKRAESITGLRNTLAHGGTMLDGRSPERAIELVEDIRRLTEGLWRLVDRQGPLIDRYAATVIRQRGRGRWPLTGVSATRRLPFPAPVHVLTAWNPASRWRSDAANRAANQELHRVLTGRGLDPTPVFGAYEDGSSGEESLLVCGLRRSEAADIGHRFGQVSIFELDEDSVHVISCEDGSVLKTVPRRRTRHSLVT